MNWTTPEMVEVNMSAEVGAYQDDFGDRDDPPIAAPVEDPPRAVSPKNA